MNEMKQIKELRKEAMDRAMNVQCMFAGRTNDSNVRGKCVPVDDHVIYCATYRDSIPYTEDEVKMIRSKLEYYGFTEVNVRISKKDGTRIAVCAHYSGNGADADAGISYKEWTLADLVRAVQSNPKMFPNGLNTRISMGDFEGNTYHRKATVGEDAGRLYLSYELHEYSDEV